MGTVVWVLVTAAMALVSALAVATVWAAIKPRRNGYSPIMTDERKDKDSVPHAGGLTESQKKEKAAKENAKVAGDPADPGDPSS